MTHGICCKVDLHHKRTPDSETDPVIAKIFANNRLWVQSQLDTDRSYFDTLSHGQSPDILYFGCSDSRVTAEQIMGLSPGEAFVHRNIANLVNALDLSAGSAVLYAVESLRVKHIVVCGHYNCGGVKAAMQSSDLGLLNPWLRQVRDVYRMHRNELNGIADIGNRYDRLVELNVIEQCINILKMAAVQVAFRHGEVKVHGWVFDIRTGKLVDLHIDAEKIMSSIEEIYKITK